MIRIFFTFIFTWIFIFNLIGQTVDYQEPIQICGAPPLDEFDIDNYLEKLRDNDLTSYRELLQKNQYQLSFNKQFSEQQVFWAYNFNSKNFYQVQATLRKTGGRVRIWVEDNSWNSEYVTQAEVDAIYNALEVSTGPNSLYPNLGIVDIDTMLFGQPPNRNGDGIIDFLILDIKDDFDPDADNFAFYAGYFFENDQTNNTGSNQRDMLYLDSQPGIFYKDNRRTTTVLSTTAHELQHLIHYHYDMGEYLWVNEGLSELASAYCGYGIGFPYLYLRDTNKNLTVWSNSVGDYARVGLWTLYIAEQLGLDFTKALTQDSRHSILSYNAILPGFTNLSFNQIYENWTIANLVNDVALNPEYGYQFSEAKGLKVLESETIYRYPQSQSGVLKQYGARYFQFLGDDTLNINFTQLPDRATMVQKVGDMISVMPINQQNWYFPDFNTSDEFIILLTNSFIDNQYIFNAYAPFSVQYYEEVAYDDYQSDGSVTVNGTAANKFIVPSAGVSLKKIKFFNVIANTSISVRVFQNDGSGKPGSMLTSPFDTIIVYPDSWVEINLPSPLQGLSAGQSIFVGIEFSAPGKSIGYDQNNSGTDLSFANVGSGWQPISNSELDGVFLIRAVFEGGLIESGQIAIEHPIALLAPNPNFGSIFLNAQLNGPGEVVIRLFNVLGQKVGEFRQNFSSGGLFPPIQLNAEGNRIDGLAAGVYFANITFRNIITKEKLNLGSQKIVLLK
jgi:hypothetical protein